MYAHYLNIIIYVPTLKSVYTYLVNIPEPVQYDIYVHWYFPLISIVKLLHGTLH